MINLKMETRSSHDIRYIITKSFKTDHEKAMNTYITNVSSLKNFSQNERKKKKNEKKETRLIPYYNEERFTI